MPTLDNVFVPLAFNLVNEFGKLITWSKAGSPGAPVYDPVTGLFDTPAATVDYPVKVSPPSAPTGDSSGEQIPDGQARTADLTFLLPAQGLAFVPESNDTVLIDGKRLTVERVHSVYSGELVVYFDVFVRL